MIKWVGKQQFYREIEKRPSVWDSRRADYNSDLKNKEWYNVAAVAFPDYWSTWNTVSKDSMVKLLVSKWTATKNYLKRELNERLLNPQKEIADYDCLKFMLPLLEKDSVDSKDQDCPAYDFDFDCDTESEENNDTNIFEANGASILEEQTDIDPVNETRDEGPPAKRRRCEEMECRRKKNEKEKLLEYEADLMFFKSLAFQLRDMTPAVKWKTKIEMMQVIQQNLTHRGLVDDELKIEIS